MATSQTLHLPKDNKLTLVFDSFANGSIYKLGNPGTQSTLVQTVSASTTLVLGPFNDERDYQIDLDNGTVSDSTSFDSTDESEIEAVIGTKTLADFVTASDNITTIGNSATGTEIATAVNAIIAALIEQGLIEDVPAP